MGYNYYKNKYISQKFFIYFLSNILTYRILISLKFMPSFLVLRERQLLYFLLSKFAP